MIRELFKKILICILMFIIILNFGLTSVTFADPPETSDQLTGDDVGDTGDSVEDAKKAVEELEKEHNDRIDGELTGTAGTLFWAVRMIFYVLAMTVDFQTTAIAASAGLNDTEALSTFITPFDIIFNRFVLTDINIFSIDGLDPDGMVATIRTTIAMWFGIISGISVGILIIILFILGIKLALLSDVPEKKAAVKQSLSDWLISLLLVLFMDLIVIAVVNINSALINAIKDVASSDISDAVQAIREVITNKSTGLILGIGALVTYMLLTIQTIIFLIKYIYRFFTVMLLILIAPLAPITYSVSKMSNKKSGTTFNTWFFEFIYAVTTQLIHAIVYTCIVGVAFQGFAASTEVNNLAALAPATFAIAAMFFVGPAERLIRTIFGIKKPGGITKIIKDVASGTREVAAAVGNIQSAASAGSATQSIIGGMFNNTANNSNVKIPGAGGVNLLHQKPVNIGENPDGRGPALEAPRDGRTDTENTRLDTTDTQLVAAAMTTEEKPKYNESDVPEVTAEATANAQAIAEAGVLDVPGGIIDVKPDEVRSGMESLEAAVSSITTKKAATTTAEATSSNTHTETETHTETHTEETEKTVETAVAPIESNLTDEEKQKIIDAIHQELSAEIEALEEKLKDQMKPDELQARLDEIKAEIVDRIKEASTEELDTILKQMEAIYGQQDNGDYLEFAKRCAMVAMADRVLTPESPRKENVGDSQEVDGGDLKDDATKQVDEQALAIRTFMIQALANAMAANKGDVKEKVANIAEREAIFKGEISTKTDTSDEGLAQITVTQAEKAKSKFNDNYAQAYEKAKRMVEKKGKAAMERVEKFRNAPSQELYQKMSEHEKTVARYEATFDAQALVKETIQDVDSSTVVRMNQHRKGNKTSENSNPTGKSKAAEVAEQVQKRKGNNN